MWKVLFLFKQSLPLGNGNDWTRRDITLWQAWKSSFLCVLFLVAKGTCSDFVLEPKNICQKLMIRYRSRNGFQVNYRAVCVLTATSGPAQGQRNLQWWIAPSSLMRWHRLRRLPLMSSHWSCEYAVARSELPVPQTQPFSHPVLLEPSFHLTSLVWQLP